MEKIIKFDSDRDELRFDPDYFKEANIVEIEYLEPRVYKITGEEDFDVEDCLKEMKSCKLNFREVE